MTLNREAIVDHLKNMVGPERVITDEQVLKENSLDRYKKFETIFGIYTTPIPAAVVKLADAKKIESVLDRAGIEYTFEITPVQGKSILSLVFGSIRKGVMFLVKIEQYEDCRSLLENAGLYNFIIE